MAAVAFAVRGDSLTARYAPGGATPGNINGVSQVNASGTGIIGAGYLDLSSTLAIRALAWPAAGNWPSSNKISVLTRAAIVGSNAASNGLFGLGWHAQIGTCMTGFQSNTLYGDVEHLSTGADIGLINGSWTPTLGQYYDIVYLFDMTSTAAGSLKIYVDGTLINDNANTGTWSTPRTNLSGYIINLGSNPAFLNTRIKVNEFVIWDGIIDPTAGGLNLNGQSRSSFISCSAFDGTTNVDPGVANVRSGTAYTIGGNSLTGTLVPSTGSRGRIVNQ